MSVLVKNKAMKKCKCRTVRLQNLSRPNQFNNVRPKIVR